MSFRIDSLRYLILRVMHFINLIAKCSVILILNGLSQSQEDLFKINKLNSIWNKAQHSLGSTKLKDLKADLIKHEADELSLKKIRAHNQDKDGLFEASVRKKLLSIISKYSLDRYFDHLGATETTDGDFTTKSSKDLPMFRDSKLDKLWKKAEKAGFDQEQLMILHEEFQHQQDKLDDHYETLNIIEDEIKRSTIGERKENSIEDDPRESKKKHKRSNKKEMESEKKARLGENIHQSLREKHSEIKNSIEELSKKIAFGIIDENAPFKEKIVNDLWTKAIQSNFSESELMSLKEQLSHYETRIEKLKHFQNQLERHELGAKDSRSYAEDEKELKHIKKKVKELTQRVDKTGKAIEKTILRDEL